MCQKGALSLSGFRNKLMFKMFACIEKLLLIMTRITDLLLVFFRPCIKDFTSSNIYIDIFLCYLYLSRLFDLNKLPWKRRKLLKNR